MFNSRRELLPDQRVVTVDGTSQQISAAITSARRTWITLQNVSTGGQIISLAFGIPAISGAGEVLGVGAAHQEVIDPAFTPTNLDINAISSAAGGLLAVQIRIEEL